MQIPDDAWATLRDYAKLRETAHKTTLTGVRVDGDGMERFVTVTIVDHGAHDPSRRYSVSAEDSDGRKATASNCERTIQLAVLGIHWSDLDHDR